jgi:hypothetical protein
MALAICVGMNPERFAILRVAQFHFALDLISQ